MLQDLFLTWGALLQFWWSIRVQLLTLLKKVRSCFSLHYLLFAFTILCEIWTIKRQQMAKMSDQVPNERLGTSRLSHVFLKIYLYDPTSKFQE